MSQILLSAAMIVRDEARHLGACLRSLRGLADEIVVVDTGSRDATRAVARRHGARVVEFPWRDDFAAARNRALDEACGRFVLYIDADERVRPARRAALARVLRDPRRVGAWVEFHARPGWTPYRELRIFRNDPRIRFEGVIHENMWPGVRAVMAADGLTLAKSGLVIDHVGYEGDQRRKLARNLPLLRRSLRAAPAKLYNWCHLACVYADLGRGREAERAWRRAVALARARGARPPNDSIAYSGYVEWRLARRKPVDRLLDEGLRRFPRNQQLRFLKGRRLMARGRFAEAVPIFAALLRHRGGAGLDMELSYDARIFGVFALQALATCHFRLGRRRQSARYWKRALACAS